VPRIATCGHIRVFIAERMLGSGCTTCTTFTQLEKKLNLNLGDLSIDTQNMIEIMVYNGELEEELESF